jgi:16S rRNA (cytosine1402-N4)-methyltransferase
VKGADVHTPILTDVILEYLRPAPGRSFIDATIDGGGHTRALLQRSAPDGRVLGIDRDPDLLRQTGAALEAEVDGGRLILAHGNFRDLEEIAANHEFNGVDGIVFDLGLSSYHLDRSSRGFSFGGAEPLDMRFDAGDPQAESAAEILAGRREHELADLFHQLGEERFSRRIARAIVRRRQSAPVQLTSELYELIVGALPGPARRHADRSAARIFQALRIAANDELGAVRAALPQAVRLLRPGGRIAVLSFHSLEDRMVKLFFREGKQRGDLEILTKKPLRAGDAEVAANPRAASAKLRVAQKNALQL